MHYSSTRIHLAAEKVGEERVDPEKDVPTKMTKRNQFCKFLLLDAFGVACSCLLDAPEDGRFVVSYVGTELGEFAVIEKFGQSLCKNIHHGGWCGRTCPWRLYK